MTRFGLLGVTDHDVRHQLRERFAHALRARPGMTLHVHGESELDDLAALDLLSDLHVSNNAGLQEFEARYAQSRENAPDLPEFAEAQARGWFRVIEGQVVIPRAVREYVYQSHPSYEQSFIALAQWSWLQHFTVGASQLQGPHANLAGRLQAHDADNFVIPVRSPAWVAARLWDHGPRDLWEWSVKWRLLGAPDLTPGEVWTAPMAAEFAHATFEAATMAGLETWNEFMDMQRSQRLRELGDERATEGRIIKSPPPHLLGKLLALRRPAWEPVEGGGTSLMALRRVALDLARRATGPLPRPELAPLMRLADAHPQVLELVEDTCRQEPRLLADLLMYPKAAISAAYLIATWEPSARNEEEDGEARRELRVTAFGDAARALAAHVQENDVDPVELVELLVALQAHQHNAPLIVREPWRRRVSQVIEVIKSATADFQYSILSMLGDRGRAGVGTPEFSVLCEVMGAVAPEVATSFHPALISAYQVAIAPGADVTDLESLPAQSASLLVNALIDQGDEGHQILGTPVQVSETLAAAKDEYEKHRVKLALASSVRAHIRILARAIAVCGEATPSALVDAFVHVIGVGASAHAEKGRVAAFSPYADVLNHWGSRQRPIADEVMQAVHRLNTESQRKIVAALLRMDEPSVLAKLSVRLSAEFRPAIENRVEQLVPDEAGHVATLSELQYTIQQLLAAGLTHAAQRFMAVEESFTTLGRAKGREIERFRTQLFVKFSKKQYADILAATPPDSLALKDKAAAQDVLDFHQGLVYLDATGYKDAVKAQAIFNRLLTKSPAEKSYAVNLLAARVDLVLPTDTFAKATGAGIERARHALADAASAIPKDSLPAEQHAIHATNVAILQLCLGLTGEALATLRAIDPADAQPASVAVEAVARAREGLLEPALLSLKHAEIRYGKHEMLDGAKQHIEAGAAYIATASVVISEMMVENLRESFARFKSATALVQAQVHGEGTGLPPLEVLLTSVVRDALASLANLVPVLHLHENLYNEDALNTLVRETLRVQLSPWYGWTVADQSRGGFTDSDGVGERDIVVAQHNTEIAVFEGMKFSTSGKRGVRSHLHKVTAYSRCEIFFHVVYAHEQKPEAVLDAVRLIAIQQVGSLTLQTPVPTPLPPLGNQPEGFLMRYEDAAGRRVAIIFLIVDLLQYGQRVAIGAVAASPMVPLSSGTPLLASSSASTLSGGRACGSIG